MRADLRFLPGALLLIQLLGACATPSATTDDDPLRNTRKLVAEGHASLYRNGAFAVPNTSLQLIPAGPDAVDLALELAGVRARQGFREAVSKAAESVEVVAWGGRVSYRAAQKLHERSDRLAQAITDASRPGGVVLIDRAIAAGGGIAGESFDAARFLYERRQIAGSAVRHYGGLAGEVVGEGGDALGQRVSRGALATGATLSANATRRAGEGFPRIGRDFVRAYARLPANAERRGKRLGDRLDTLDPRLATRAAEGPRALWSARFADLAGSTISGYGQRVGTSLGQAGNEIARHDDGVSLAALRALRWVLQALVWDGAVEPLAKVGTASLGYLVTNLVAYPTLVVAHEGQAVTRLAIEVTRDSASTAWNLVAPTGAAALAGVFQTLDFTAGQVAGGATAGGGYLAGQVMRGGARVIGVGLKGGSQVVGTGVEYLGVPLAAAGVAVTGGTVGTVVGGVGAAGGGTVLVGGEVAAAGSQVFGNLLAGGTLLGGSTVAAVGGATYGVYQLASAVVVPAGYEVGGGIVLSYGTTSQLAAQSLLAVADCAYLVLSLEGPRWVLYAVRGNTGDDPPPGAVVDLKAMREAGEELLNLPIDDATMKALVDHTYDNLPVAR